MAAQQASGLLGSIKISISAAKRTLILSVAAQWEWQRPIDLFHRGGYGTKYF
jgi:hypothetical protein